MIEFDGGIVFDPVAHKYSTKEGSPLLGVSEIIHRYTPPFDPDGKKIKKAAEKAGVSIEEMRKRWDKLRDDSTVKGHAFHSSAEHFIKKGEILEDEFKPYVEQLASMRFDGKLYSETIVYSLEYGYAGTVDLIEEHDNGEISIWDFKTNKELRKFSFYKNMLPPLGHIPDSIFDHYRVQLSLYAYALDLRGYWINTLNLLYINPKTQRVEHHPVEYLRKEVVDILDDIQSKKLDPVG